MAESGFRSRACSPTATCATSKRARRPAASSAACATRPTPRSARPAAGRPSRSNARLREIRDAKGAIIAKHPKVDSDNPTPEYAKLHREERRVNERPHRLTDGKYGHHYKEPWSPSGAGSSSGGGLADWVTGDANRAPSRAPAERGGSGGLADWVTGGGE